MAPKRRLSCSAAVCHGRPGRPVGEPAEPSPPIADRKFLEIDLDNFDSRMKALKRRAGFQVPICPNQTPVRHLVLSVNSI
jgi:hypothetical protein